MDYMSRQKQNKFIAIEGIDGVGKSTIAEGVATQLRMRGIAVRVFSLFPPFLELRDEIENVASTYSRYLFYLASNAAISEYVSNRIEQEWIICDRYVYSTQAYHIAEGLKCPLKLENMEIQIPNHSFLITLNDEQLRQDRLAARGRYSQSDHLLRTAGGFLNKVENIYREYGLTPVDNSFAGPTPQFVRLLVRRSELHARATWPIAALNYRRAGAKISSPVEARIRIDSQAAAARKSVSASMCRDQCSKASRILDA